MTLLTQDCLEQIYQAVKEHYAHGKSKLIVSFYDSGYFFLLRCMREVSKK